MADVNIDAKFREMSVTSSENVIEKYRKCKATSDTEKMKECFKSFDKDGDGFLNEQEFGHLLDCVFANNGEPFSLSNKQKNDILKLLDEDQDGKLSKEEFKTCWHHWLKQVLDAQSVLIIVDVQNDFIGGSLAIKNCPAGQDGEAVVPVINKMLDEVDFDVVVYSADWHPADHISFIENVHKRAIHKTSKTAAEDAKTLDTVIFDGVRVTEQKLWPSHCVQNTHGAKMHTNLKIVENSIFVNKGTNPDIDSYSAFWDNHKLSQTPLLADLTSRNITDVYVCGLAYDICVGATAQHSIEHGFRTVVVDDACRGVSLPDIEAMKENLLKQGAVITDSTEVKNMVDAKIRHPVMGRQAAINVAMARRLLKEKNNIK